MISIGSKVIYKTIIYEVGDRIIDPTCPFIYLKYIKWVHVDDVIEISKKVIDDEGYWFEGWKLAKNMTPSKLKDVLTKYLEILGEIGR